LVRVKDPSLLVEKKPFRIKKKGQSKEYSELAFFKKSKKKRGLF